MTDFDRDAVLARAAERRRLNDERIAELGIDTSPEGVGASVSAQVRDQADRRRAQRAEQLGQLDLGGQ